MDDRQVVREYDDRESPSWSGVSIVVRLVTVLFGILQLFLILRIVLLLLGADQSNTIVADIIDGTKPFVEPFRGMFSLDAISATAGSILDVAAIVAFVGWTILEAIVVAVLRIVGR